MPTMIDIFNNDAFSVQELTNAINIIPNKYGRIKELGIFSEQGITTTTAIVEIKNGTLNILPQTHRGGPASQGNSDKRRLKSFIIPNFSHEDSIKADEVQNVRAFGQVNAFETIQNRVLEKLEKMRSKHDITLEYLRAGALSGKVKDGEGNIIFDFFNEMEVSEKQIDFKFGTDTTDIPKLCRDVSRHMKKNLNGEAMSSVYCLCSASYFDKLIAHKSVKEAFYAYQQVTPYREDLRNKFVFQGITFEEYTGYTSNKKGDVLEFIKEGEAQFFPLGTSSTFTTYFAPADFEETVNTVGQPLYAKQAADQFGRQRTIFTQSNPLPVCLRPNLLIKGLSSN